MPYNPLKKAKMVIEDIKKQGYTFEVPIQILEKTTMNVMGIINDKTLAQTIRGMERAGLIELKGVGIFKINTQLENHRTEEEKMDDLLDSEPAKD